MQSTRIEFSPSRPASGRQSPAGDAAITAEPDIIVKEMRWLLDDGAEGRLALPVWQRWPFSAYTTSGADRFPPLTAPARH